MKPVMNPIEEHHQKHYSKLAASTPRQEKEFGQWQQWQQGGKQPEHLEPLLNSYNTLIKRKAQEYGGGAVMIPKEALEAEVTKHVIGAFETYDPNRGTSLLTHVYHRIPKAQRFVVRSQNMAYIPEPKANRIGDISRASSDLMETLGRKPSPAEIAEHPFVSRHEMTIKQVKATMKAQVKDVPSSSLESDPTLSHSPRDQEVLSLLPSVLNHEEKRVFDLIYHPTTPIISTTELAKRLNKNMSQVSRLKSSIIKKFEANR